MHIFTKTLIENAEENYKAFSKKLIPDTHYEILGIRVPTIKNIAKKYKTETLLIKNFFEEKHFFYEEWFLHGIMINQASTNVADALILLDKFLPFLDNWAICDSTSASLKILKKDKDITLNKIKEWIKSDNPYTIRFAVTVLMNYYLSENTQKIIFEYINSINSDNYYVNMAIAWFYSVALVKCYDQALYYIKEAKLKLFIHNKAIQKAIESYRISDSIKKYLRTLKRKF